MTSHAGSIGRSTAVVAATSGLLLTAGLPANATSTGVDAVSYTVASGDTLGAISTRYGVELDTVFSLNGMNQNTIIYPGDTIALTDEVGIGGPAPAAPPAQAISVPASPAPAPPAATAAPAVAPAAPAPAMAPVNRLRLPLATASVNSPFGYRGAGELHTGIDFSAGCDTPVLSSSAGTVIEAGFSAYGGGNRIVIDHGNGVQTTYNHLATIGVQLNQSVKTGTPIGVAGSTGNSTGCHLHFEVVVNGQTVDPAPWLEQQGVA